MSVDHRSRRHEDVADLDALAAFDEYIPDAIDRHGELAACGVASKGLAPLGFDLGDHQATLVVDGETLVLVDGLEHAGVVAHLPADALSDLLQDRQSTMGLAMTARVKIERGSLDDWIRWEPALRALLDGRAVHESGAVAMVDGDGDPLDLDRRFTLEDDRDEMRHFLTEAGFLHLTGVFDPDEMARIGHDIDESIAAAADGDPEYWWCTNSDGEQVAVRSLNFQEKSEAVRAALTDERLLWLGELTGDAHRAPTTCEGLVKPLDIVQGLSDLPWHKDCGQGLHSYMCNSLTVGISVTGADRVSGALGVIPGSHRANTVASMRDRDLDLPSRLLETTTGDITVHCSDTLHRAYPPSAHPRKVVYTSFRLAPLDGDEEKPNPRYSRSARSELTSVQDRIAAADNAAADNRYVPSNG
ncbi:MAG: phytanoyl-CoA dioxygenase family protein [Actinomycetota bacterium]